MSYWDIHNHILPGVDDGSSCYDETEELIAREYEQGIRNVIFTPHYRKGMFEIDSKERLEVYKRTVVELQKSYPDMHIYYGCELYLSPRSIDCIKDVLNLIHGKKLLLAEFNYEIEYPLMVKLIKHAMSCGLMVIIAHVERYECVKKDMDKIAELRSMGCLIQVNADSVIGKYGLGLKMISNKLIKNNLVDFVASDAHDVDYRDVRMDKAMKHITKKYGQEMTELLFRKNAERLFGIRS